MYLVRLLWFTPVIDMQDDHVIQWWSCYSVMIMLFSDSLMIMLCSDDHVIQCWHRFLARRRRRRRRRIAKMQIISYFQIQKKSWKNPGKKLQSGWKCENLTINMILSYGEEFLQGRTPVIVPTLLIYAATRKSEFKCLTENHACLGEGPRTDIASHHQFYSGRGRGVADQYENHIIRGTKSR